MQIALAVVGVLAITAEFATGTIRPTLTAVPARTKLVLAGLGLGAVTRSTAGGLASIAGLLFVVPGMANLLPEPWGSGSWR